MSQLFYMILISATNFSQQIQEFYADIIFRVTNGNHFNTPTHILAKVKRFSIFMLGNEYSYFVYSMYK